MSTANWSNKEVAALITYYSGYVPAQLVRSCGVVFCGLLGSVDVRLCFLAERASGRSWMYAGTLNLRK